MTSETTPPPAVTTAQVVTPVVQDNATQTTVTSPVVPKTEVPLSEPSPTIADPVTPPVSGQTTQQDWAIKRINELTAKRYEAERKAETEGKARLVAEEDARKAKELIAQIKGATPPDSNAQPTAKPVGMTDAEMEKLIEERAVQKAQLAAFNSACNQVDATGKKEFADWKESLDNLTLVGALGKDVPSMFLETAVELKDPHKILHHLGKNMDEAARIAKLPPQKMAVEMARIEASFSAPPPPIPVSAAPPPVIPVAGATKISSGSLDDPTLSNEEWQRLRDEQVLAKKRRYLKA